MAVSPRVWATGWTILSERFHISLSEPSENLWFEEIGEFMNDEEFVQVSKLIWRGDSKFLPPPATFRELARGLRQDNQNKVITAAEVNEEWGAPTPPPDWLSAWTALRLGFKRRFGANCNLALLPPNSEQGTPATLSLALANGDVHQFRQVDGRWCCDRSDLNQVAQEILATATPVQSLSQIIGCDRTASRKTASQPLNQAIPGL